MHAILLSFATACSSIWVKFSSKFMEEAEKEAELRGGGLAKWMFVVGDHTTVALKEKIFSSWRYLTSDFEEKYYQRLNYICRNYETQGLDKDQVLRLQRVFVPLKISQKSLAKISSDLIQTSLEELSNPQEIGQILVKMAESESAFRRLAILGAPGSGKTTLLRYLTLIYANRQQHRILHSKAPSYTPVLIYLRDVRRDIIDEEDLSLVALIEIWIQRLQKLEPLKSPPNWFTNKLKRNKCLILLDGLDEIADETERQQVSRWVDSQMQEYPEAAFILSSRPLGYKSAKLQQDITVLEVQPFDHKQVKKFIHNWYLATEIRSQENTYDLGVKEEAHQQAEDLVKRIQNSSPLASMAVNPLLLTMIATVHRRGSALPGKRIELYKEICQVLLERRQRAKNISIPDPLTASQKESVLKFLAVNLMQNKTRSFSLTPEINELLQSKLALVIIDAPTSANFLKQMREVSGLLIAKEEGVYEFAHLSFQEYLASVEIKESYRESILIRALQDLNQLSWWAETIRLYCAQSDASNIIQAALKSHNIDSLSLSFDCLEEGLSVKPTVRNNLENLLKQGLESKNLELFKLAAETKLFRRLKHLFKTEEKIAIDSSYITCAEYQLFIDEQRNKKKYHHPDHWQTEHFPENMASRPITGVRASDARVFCQWLSQRTGRSYRLPHPHEVEKQIISNLGIGTWCLNPKSETYSLIGVPSKYWQQYRSSLCTELNRFFLQDFSLALDRDRSVDRDRTLDRSLDFSSIRNRDITIVSAMEIMQAHAQARELVFELANNLDRVRDDCHSPVHTLEYVSKLAHEIDVSFISNINSVCVHDSAYTCALNLVRELDLARENFQSFIRSYSAVHLSSLRLQIEDFSNSKILGLWKHIAKQGNNDKNVIAQKINIAFLAYVIFLVFHLRKSGLIPAWESILIVREEN